MEIPVVRPRKRPTSRQNRPLPIPRRGHSMTTTRRQSPKQPPQPPKAVDLLGPQEVLQIQDQGLKAYRANQPVTTCPWANAQAPNDQARRKMWVAGFARGRTELRQARNQ
ncbi:Rmf/CrpP family protein [Kibdelosporangium lantanae]|uniref:Rmf/CrpP family protein n=1 Tax=Kibdelosporangium lantanae TaxID=1497396 RepID=A0ABW3M2E9_9PSEU